ncbi:MAG: HAMP domain-containing histidine kinase [bacterium]|nr:HAMP domain-containing histidine kinase [bacterium]
MSFSPRSALALFLFMALTALALAVWWIIFMAHLVDEKVEIAQQLGASPEMLEQIHQQEISRQIMLGMEGVFLILLILLGGWLIYRALVKTEELKFHQQNFLMAVTHELKTPLASIKLYLDTIQSPKIEASKKETIIPKIQQDVARLEHLVQNILDAGRFERSGYRLNKIDVNLSDLVRERVAVVRGLPSSVAKQVTDEIQPDIMIDGDQLALGRAIDSILENSLKYHDGSGIQIDLKLKEISGRITLTITDRGIGFEKKDNKAIFDRFYRVGDEMTRTQAGTGLGLFLCREIIRAHGGTVTAESDGPGKGATFTISLKKS